MTTSPEGSAVQAGVAAPVRAWTLQEAHAVRSAAERLDSDGPTGAFALLVGGLTREEP